MLDFAAGRLGRELAIAGFGLPMRDLEPWVLDRITSLLTTRWAAAGDTLYREGEPPEYMYFMTDGAVRLTRRDAPPWTMRGRWVFGALEGLAGLPRERTATAIADFQAMQVPLQAWVELLEDSFQLARAIIVNAARATAQLEERATTLVDRPRPHWEHIRTDDAPLTLVERLALLAEVRVLGGAGVQSVVDLAAASRERRFEAGATLLPRGVERVEALLVVSGQVTANRLDPDVERRYGPGDLVAGVASFGAPARHWEARAATPTRVISFPIETWFDLMEEHFDLVRSTLGALAARRELLLESIAQGPDELVLT